ncbi:hypothetical protein ACJ6WF_25540 [Streptomyces sp. MMS24-I2-30]|uniref:hypothetical protein n=1 Tax=Streptomyces sp. MMS24-I2-30 TaxID=3351564 RepID=UPI003896AE6D
MVTSTHETSHRIFQDHPEVLGQIFEALGLPPPVKADIEPLTPDATEIKPLERRVDTVLKIEPSDGDSFLIAVEAQTKKAPDKGVNWAYYVSYLHAKYQLPVLLVAVCRNRSTAAWAKGPFECRVGPWETQVTRPFVLGPDTVPRITDESDVARQPALATLSAIVHSESEHIEAILELLARGMRSFDKSTALYWSELLEVGLENTPARALWRELEKMVVTFFPGRGTVFEEAYLDGQAKGYAAGVAEGKAAAMAEGKAESVLRILEVRGLSVSDDVRERISACTDLARLDDWLDRSGTVERAEELFDGEPRGAESQESKEDQESRSETPVSE